MNIQEILKKSYLTKFGEDFYCGTIDAVIEAMKDGFTFIYEYVDNEQGRRWIEVHYSPSTRTFYSEDYSQARTENGGFSFDIIQNELSESEVFEELLPENF